MFEKVWKALCICFVFGVIIWTGYWIFIPASQPPVAATIEPVCENKAIDFEKKTVETEDYEIGFNEITEYGEKGERKVCTNSDGAVVSDEVIAEPKPELTTIGVAEPEVEYYAERSGATCNDGTYSSATGSGACSWHGGVAEWLY